MLPTEPLRSQQGNVVNSQTDIVQMSALSDKEVYMPIVAVTLNGTIPYWIPVPVTRSVRIDWSEIWASKVNKKCIDQGCANFCHSRAALAFTDQLAGRTETSSTDPCTKPAATGPIVRKFSWCTYVNFT